MFMRHIARQGFSPFALKVLLLAATWGSTGSGLANEALARKSGCLGCHAVNVKLVGPAYHDVATKYAGQSDGLEQLTDSVRHGSVGKWGDLPMPAHPKLSAADVKKLATWVLSAK